jgi:hypothetical protein
MSLTLRYALLLAYQMAASGYGTRRLHERTASVRYALLVSLLLGIHPQDVTAERVHFLWSTRSPVPPEA